MNREIKFRAWDIKFKKMIFTGFHLMGEVIAFHLIEQHCFETKADGSSLKRWNDIKVMQFTGLLDKNGKEIYEGDVVRTDEAGWIGEVVFDRDGWICIDKKRGFASHCNWEQFEIIGNIYESDLDIVNYPLTKDGWAS